MSLPHVFAKGTATVTDLGYPVTVHAGTCWLADDALVLARPDMFTEDCRPALFVTKRQCGCGWTGGTPECMRPPGDGAAAPDDGFSSAAMTRGTRAKSRTERARAGQ